MLRIVTKNNESTMNGLNLRPWDSENEDHNMIHINGYATWYNPHLVHGKTIIGISLKLAGTDPNTVMVRTHGCNPIFMRPKIVMVMKCTSACVIVCVYLFVYIMM